MNINRQAWIGDAKPYVDSGGLEELSRCYDLNSEDGAEVQALEVIARAITEGNFTGEVDGNLDVRQEIANKIKICTDQTAGNLAKEILSLYYSKRCNSHVLPEVKFQDISIDSDNIECILIKNTIPQATRDKIESILSEHYKDKHLDIRYVDDVDLAQRELFGLR